MLQLIGLTIVTGGMDSLNPIALGQQMVLQGMVKRRRDIWLFILGTGVTNFVGGLLIYFGLLEVILAGVNWIWQGFEKWIRWGGLGIGVLLFIYGCGLLFRLIKVRGKVGSVEAVVIEKQVSVHPIALFGLGSLATVFELSTALPYFAFLGLLFQANISNVAAVLILVLYNVLYMLPLMVLYVVFVYFEDKVGIFLEKIQLGIVRVMGFLKPIIFLGVGLLLIVLTS